jgi:hypothetical protein
MARDDATRAGGAALAQSVAARSTANVIVREV